MSKSIIVCGIIASISVPLCGYCVFLCADYARASSINAEASVTAAEKAARFANITVQNAESARKSAELSAQNADKTSEDVKKTSKDAELSAQSARRAEQQTEEGRELNRLAKATLRDATGQVAQANHTLARAQLLQVAAPPTAGQLIQALGLPPALGSKLPGNPTLAQIADTTGLTLETVVATYKRIGGG